MIHKIQKYLINDGVEILFDSEFKELILDKSRVIRVIVENLIYKSNNIVLVMGRNGFGHFLTCAKNMIHLVRVFK